MIRNDTTVPRLHVGKGPEDGSAMCAMQVVSWESGDTIITDLPSCADPMLARIVQRLNDSYCPHSGGGAFLCPACSIEVLALAHRTVGTSQHGLSDAELRRVYARVACRLAREVVHLADNALALRAIEAAERWAENPTADAAIAAARGARAAGNAAGVDLGAAASWAIWAAVGAAKVAGGGDVQAAYACASACVDRGAIRMAHLAIDEFLRLTAPDQQATAPVHSVCATN